MLSNDATRQVAEFSLACGVSCIYHFSSSLNSRGFLYGALRSTVLFYSSSALDTLLQSYYLPVHRDV